MTGRLIRTLILFARDHWKGGIFFGLCAPSFFRLADSLRERIALAPASRRGPAALERATRLRLEAFVASPDSRSMRRSDTGRFEAMARSLCQTLFATVALHTWYPGPGSVVSHPKASSQRVPAAVIPGGARFVPRTTTFRSADGLDLDAWWVPREGSSGAAILAHGRGDSKSSAYVVETASIYLGAGFSVLMIDLRKHSWSEGRFSTAGYQEARDVTGALSWLAKRGFDPGTVVLHGWSTGAAAVVRAAPGTGVGAVVEEGGHADLPLLLGSLVPGENGPSILLSHVASLTARLLGVEFDPFEVRPRREAARLYEEGVPLLIIHSLEDRVVPAEHGRMLAAAHPGAALWEVEGYGHTAAYAHPEYAGRLVSFLRGALDLRRDHDRDATSG